MNDKGFPEKLKKFLKDASPMIIAEAVCVLIIIAGGGLLHLLGFISYDYTIITGALLGYVITIANYLFLTVSVDREINRFMAMRGNKEMSDEEAEKFAAENSAPIQNAIKLSFIIRTLSIGAALLIAFITRLFSPLATVIPLLGFRPLLSLTEGIKSKRQNPPDKNKFIKYENEEKESD